MLCESHASNLFPLYGDSAIPDILKDGVSHFVGGGMLRLCIAFKIWLCCKLLKCQWQWSSLPSLCYMTISFDFVSVHRSQCNCLICKLRNIHMLPKATMHWASPNVAPAAGPKFFPRCSWNVIAAQQSKFPCCTWLTKIISTERLGYWKAMNTMCTSSDTTIKPEKQCNALREDF